MKKIEVTSKNIDSIISKVKKKLEEAKIPTGTCVWYGNKKFDSYNELLNYFKLK